MATTHRVGAGQIGNDQAGLRLLEHGAPGHPDHKIVGVCAALPLGTAVLPVRRRVLALVAEVHQGGKVVVGHKDDVAAAAAVAAVGTARRHEFFPVEGHGAVAALAGVQQMVAVSIKLLVAISVPRAVQGTV